MALESVTYPVMGIFQVGFVMSIVAVFIVLTLVGRIQEIVPFLSYVKPVMLGMTAGLICLVLFCPPDALGKKWRRPTLFWCLTALGFALSVPTSLYMSKSVEFLVLSYLCTAVLFLLISQCFRRFEQIEILGASLVGMAFILGVAMLISPRKLLTDTGFRLSVSSSYDSNDLALVFAMSVPFLFYWFWRAGAMTKAFVTLTALLAVWGVYRTGSRGGLISLATVIVFMTFRVKELGPTLRGMLVVAMIAGAALATQTETFDQLILGIQGKDYNATAEDGRLQIWQRGIRYAVTHPLFGVGVQCFEEAEGLLSGRSTATRGIRWSSAHNSYIELLAENGFITFFLWLAMILASFRELARLQRLLSEWRHEREVHRMLVMVGMVQASLLTYVVGGIFLSLAYLSYLYLLVGMTVALAEMGDSLARRRWAEEDTFETS